MSKILIGSSCALCLLLGACIGKASKVTPTPTTQPTTAAQTKLCMTKPQKNIRIDEHTTKQEIVEQISANLPKLKDHPEQFIPCYAFAHFVRDESGNAVRCAVHYRFSIPTNMGPMEFSGVTQTNEQGFYAIMLPDGINAEITLDKERR